MPRIRTLTMFTLLTIMVTALAACGGAPAPQSSSATAASAASGGASTAETGPTVIPAQSPAPAPTNAPAPTRAPAPTAAATSVPLADTNSAKPDDATQARLRVSNCIFNGPSVDVLVNGKDAVNGGMPQANLDALNASGYLYLEPGNYSVALVPTGKGIDQALLGPVDVPIVAGHRYIVAMLGQADEKSHTPLVIDETEAYQAAGVTPSDVGHITINNIKGVPGLDFALDDRVRDKNAPYGGYTAALWPSGTFKKLAVTVSGSPDKVIDSADLSAEKVGGFLGAGVDYFDCFAGAYPGTMGDNFNVESSAYTSLLNTPDFLQLQSDESAKDGGQTPGFTTFLKALKTTRMADMLASGGPYLVFAPTDEAFAALPKDTLDALMADPKALADLVRSHIVEGYYPYGSLSAAPGLRGPDRTVTNLRGNTLKLLYTTINGQETGDASATMVANGTRINPVNKLLLPDTK